MNKRVLIVEDNECSRDLMVRVLTMHGHDVVAVADGLAAWELLDGGAEFDQIFSDRDMPNMDGLELLGRVRADSRTSGISFTLISGREVVSSTDSTSLEAAAAKLGAGFMLKPVDFYELAIWL